jgi:hypothetical protein
MSKGELLPYLGGRWKERVRNLALKIHSTSRKLEFSAVAKPKKIKSRRWHSALSARSGFTNCQNTSEVVFKQRIFSHVHAHYVVDQFEVDLLSLYIR